ncbi:hypothetical protein J6590_089538 [Homalodisca vitripennis]|nr:hypothetical protein J6590_089538 [Homalodisca vitripennis]
MQKHRQRLCIINLLSMTIQEETSNTNFTLLKFLSHRKFAICSLRMTAAAAVLIAAVGAAAAAAITATQQLIYKRPYPHTTPRYRHADLYCTTLTPVCISTVV